MYISIHTQELRCILFPLIILEMFLQLDWSPPVVHGVDWTWFGKVHTCLYKVPQLTEHVRAQVNPWSPRNCLQRQDCIEAQIWGRVQTHFCSIEGSQKHVISVTLNGRSLKRPGLFLELAKLSTWWRRALSRLVTKNLISGDRRNLQKDKHHCNTPPIWDLCWCVQTQSSLQWSHMKTHLKDPQTVRNKILWSDEPLSIMFEGNQPCSSPEEHHPISKVHSVGLFFSDRDKAQCTTILR